MTKMQQTQMWNQGYNIDSGIQTAAPSVKDFDDDVSSHHSHSSFQQFNEWDQNMASGEAMDTQMNDQFNNSRRYLRITNYQAIPGSCTSNVLGFLLSYFIHPYSGLFMQTVRSNQI